MIEFNCSQCGVKIRTPHAFAGRKGKCPKCGAHIVTPAPSGQAVKPPPVPGKDELIQYKCSKCKSVLESHTAMAGREDVCPACGTANKVPHTKQQLEAIKLQQEEEKRRQEEENRKAEELKRQEVEERELQARLSAEIRDKAGLETPILPEDFSSQPPEPPADQSGDDGMIPLGDEQSEQSHMAAAPQEPAAPQSEADAVGQQPQRRAAAPGQAVASILGFVYLALGVISLAGGGVMLVLGFIYRQKLPVAEGQESHLTAMQAFLAGDSGLVSACGLLLAGLIMAGLGKLYLFARSIAQGRR
ncbi:MAG: hypothetical protein HZA50_11250 [Planctomycetes bacterium]|nr:hypothetical protein [Planctomycetota bacterium]